jgi:hypothetical protein
VQIPRCSWQSTALDETPYKLFGAVAKLASITFWSLVFSYWTIKPWFLTEGKLLLYSSYLPLGVPNWMVIHINCAATSNNFLAPLPGKKKTSARGVSHAHPLLCFKFCFTLFLLASFYQKYKKISFLIVVILLLLVHYVVL